MWTFAIQLFTRFFGYGVTAAAGYVGAKYGAEAGAAVGVVGGVVMNKVNTNIIPRLAK